MSHSTASLVSNAITSVTPESLKPISWHQAHVITTELLAKVYKATEKQLRQNFNNNFDRFVEGKHFFKLEGKSLQAFKNSIDNFDAVQKHTRNMILWTERGAARHAKMLGTDAAWEVFEKLEDCYFEIAKPTQALTYTKISPAQAQTLKEHVQRVVEAGLQTFGETWGRLHNKFRVNSYLELPATQFEEACAYLKSKNPISRYHFPLETADPHDREIGNAWLSPRVLTDPKNGVPELELIAQLEKDGHNVTGAKVRILAMRDAMCQVEEAKSTLRYVYEKLGPLLETCKVGIFQYGKNVQFIGKPNPSDPISRFVYRDQM